MRSRRRARLGCAVLLAAFGVASLGATGDDIARGARYYFAEVDAAVPAGGAPSLPHCTAAPGASIDGIDTGSLYPLLG